MTPSDPFILHVAPFSAGLPVAEFHGREALSHPYRFDLRVLTPVPLSLGDLPPVGSPASLVIAPTEEGEASRFVHGVLARSRVIAAAKDRNGTWLDLRIVPRLGLLRHHRAYRIFQDQSVEATVTTLLRAHGVPHRWQLDARPPVIGYVTQYGESDLAFVERLLAEHGIFYFFEHPAAGPGSDEKEVVVFTDAARHCPNLSWLGQRDVRELKLAEREGTYRPSEALFALPFTWRARPTAVRLHEYDFRVPRATTDAAAQTEDEVLLARDRFLRDEFADHGGHDTRRLGPRDARTALEQLRARTTFASGRSDCRGLDPGRRFASDGHDVAHLNRQWLVTRIEHHANVARLTQDPSAATSLVYHNAFDCVPSNVSPRPQRRVRPLRQVTETAVVVGPENEEIHTDEYGRIKVQFHWDREGARNDRSSCWVRVAQTWAGSGWGTQFIPRVGMEVLVAFLGGDTDDPVVVGCFPNAEHLPLHPVPAQKSRSGIRTQSTPGGLGFNELTFEDAAGQEFVYLHAQRDLREEVRLDHATSVGRHQTIGVGGDQRVDVGGSQNTGVRLDQGVHVGRNQATRVEGHRAAHVAGNDALEVTGRRTIQVGGDLHASTSGHRVDSVGKDHTVLVAGSQFVFIDGTGAESGATGGWTVEVTGGARVQASKTIDLEAADAIRLRCGSSRVEITRDEVRIVTPALTVSAEDRATLHGSDASLTLDGNARLLGGEALVRASGSEVKLAGEATVAGSTVHLRSSGGGSGSGSSEDLAAARPEERMLPVAVRTGLHDGQQPTGELVVRDGEGHVVRRLPASAGRESHGTLVYEFDPAELPNPVEMVWQDGDHTLHLLGPCSPTQLHARIARGQAHAARPLLARKAQRPRRDPRGRRR